MRKRVKKNLDFPKNQIFQTRPLVCENSDGCGGTPHSSEVGKAAEFETVPRDFFITATDTDVGKTFVGAHLADVFLKGGKKVGYFKPFQSGVESGILSDIEKVSQICPDVITKNSYITKTPACPALSSEIEGVEIKLEKVLKDYEELKNECEIVISEGSGGLFVPVNNSLLMSDVILALNLPVIIVARPDLGTINHTLLTIECAKKCGIEILGIIISNYPKDTTDPVLTTAKKYIEKFSSLKVLAILNHCENGEKPEFEKDFLEHSRGNIKTGAKILHHY